MKKLWKLCTIGGMALVIAACGNGEEEADTGEDAATEEEENSQGDPATEDEGADDTDTSDDTETEETTDTETDETESTESEDGTEEDDTSATTDEDAANGEEESKTFVYEEEGYLNELEYYYIDDEVQRQTSRSEMTYEALGVSNEDEARELLDDLGDEYNDLDGVTQSIEYGEDGIVETLEVDYDEADLAEVAGLEGSEFEEGAEDAQFISMESSEEQLLAEGYELTEE